MSEKEEFEKALSAYNNHVEASGKLYSRKSKAKEDIEKLETQLQDLKEKRPQMLADEIDITNLNKEMKEVEEQISIKIDEITGLEAKLLEIKKQDLPLMQEVNDTYEKLVEPKLEIAKKKYNKLAKQFAEITKECSVLQELSRGPRKYVHYSCLIEKFNFIPALDSNDEPFLKTTYWDVMRNNKDTVAQKYELPDFKYFQDVIK